MASLHGLNWICPYYTMFPLEFPLRVLGRHAEPGDWVLDPFCGRGTTNFAARILGFPSVGIDSSPVAAAIAQAKLALAAASEVIACAERILMTERNPEQIPRGRFWRLAYHPTTLDQICRLRAGLLNRCYTDSHVLLRAIMLGALHGPLRKGTPTYLSNQCPRTFAPKPRYAVKFWAERMLRPPKVDVLDVIRIRAERYLREQPPSLEGEVRCGDSRSHQVFSGLPSVSWVITSPPYYGMRTYIPDQWLRFWFVGGPSEVTYTFDRQIKHSSPDQFVQDLSAVWTNTWTRCKPGARLVARIGGVNDRKQNALQLMAESLAKSGWRIQTAVRAGDACDGFRQAKHFGRADKEPVAEYDIYARWESSIRSRKSERS